MQGKRSVLFISTLLSIYCSNASYYNGERSHALSLRRSSRASSKSSSRYSNRSNSKKESRSSVCYPPEKFSPSKAKEPLKPTPKKSFLSSLKNFTSRSKAVYSDLFCKAGIRNNRNSSYNSESTSKSSSSSQSSESKSHSSNSSVSEEEYGRASGMHAARSSRSSKSSSSSKSKQASKSSQCSSASSSRGVSAQTKLQAKRNARITAKERSKSAVQKSGQISIKKKTASKNEKTSKCAKLAKTASSPFANRKSSTEKKHNSSNKEISTSTSKTKSTISTQKGNKKPKTKSIGKTVSSRSNSSVTSKSDGKSSAQVTVHANRESGAKVKKVDGGKTAIKTSYTAAKPINKTYIKTPSATAHHHRHRIANLLIKRRKHINVKQKPSKLRIFPIRIDKNRENMVSIRDLSGASSSASFQNIVHSFFAKPQVSLRTIRLLGEHQEIIGAGTSITSMKSASNPSMRISGSSAQMVLSEKEEEMGYSVLKDSGKEDVFITQDVVGVTYAAFSERYLEDIHSAFITIIVSGHPIEMPVYLVDVDYDQSTAYEVCILDEPAEVLKDSYHITSTMISS